MTTMTVEFEKGQAVSIFIDGEWWKGIVTGIDEKSERPYQVRYSENGVGDEAWFSRASIKAS